MRGEHHPTFRSFFSLSPLFPARSFDPSVSAFLSQLFNLKVKEAFFAKAGKRRKRHAETTESSGKSGNRKCRRGFHCRSGTTPYRRCPCKRSRPILGAVAAWCPWPGWACPRRKDKSRA